ncbi:MAG: phosphatidate cytidylyltransferase [Clostridiales bacterium]|nr:phosphatidate cytidylyltransferase [Clostridiales bacterium]
MKRRIITTIIGLPILIYIVSIGGYALQFTLLIVSIIGMSEFYNAMKHKDTGSHVVEIDLDENSDKSKRNVLQFSVSYLGYGFTVLYYAMLHLIRVNEMYFFVLATMLITLSLIAMVIFHGKLDVMDCAVTLFGFLYVAFMMSFIYFVRMQVLGKYFVWLIFISAFGCDTFAYFTGKLLGKHKLAPKLSPNKTIEGLIGGLVGSALLATAFGFVLVKIYDFKDINIVAYCFVVGAVGAVFSTFGDLAASSIKRDTQIKDFGKIIFGHGGVLDRFDSVIFAAPMMYLMLLILLNK